MELIGLCPVAALRDEFQADNGSAGKGAPINDTGARPEVAADRLEQQNAAGFPKALCRHASAARADIMRRGGFRAPVAAKVGELHRLAHDRALFAPDTSVGSKSRFAWAHGLSPGSNYWLKDGYSNPVFTLDFGWVSEAASAGPKIRRTDSD